VSDLVAVAPQLREVLANVVKPRARHGCVTRRFEGIDALEIYFQNHHQNLQFGTAARDVMLALRSEPGSAGSDSRR
jgi:hypothetical protein